jgi:formate dehydrogenase
LIVVSGDPLASIPGSARLQRALQNLEFLVCLDLFQNATGREADLILPTTSWLERWDLATTTVGFQQAPMIQYAGGIQPAPGETRSEPRILADLSLACDRPLFGSTMLTRLWGRIPWDTLLTVLFDIVLLPIRPLLRGARGIPTPRPSPGHYLGRGPRTPGQRVRFWHGDLDAEPQRLAAYAAELETPVPNWNRSQSGALQPGSADATLWCTMICRRRRLGHNSWLHGAVRDGKSEAAVWASPQDLANLGLPNGGEVLLSTASAALQVTWLKAWSSSHTALLRRM